MKKTYLVVVFMVISSVITLAATHGWFYLTHPTGSVYIMVKGTMVELDPRNEYITTVREVVAELDKEQVKLPDNCRLSINQGYDHLLSGPDGKRALDLVYYNGLDTGDIFTTMIELRTNDTKLGWTTKVKNHARTGVIVDGKPTTFPQRKETAIDAARDLAERMKG